MQVGCLCVSLTVLERLAMKRLHERVIFKSRSERTTGASHEEWGRIFQADTIVGQGPEAGAFLCL